MKSVLSTNSIKEAELFTIEKCGIEASVLMERAAVEVAFSVMEKFKNKNSKILIVCGGGNNGADGLCVARILLENGYRPFVFSKNSKSDLHKLQLRNLTFIVENCIKNANKNDIFVNFESLGNNYDVIIDALYGIGINRPLESDDICIVNYINKSDAYIVSIDIPSGLDSTTGYMMSSCVKADETVCIGYFKQGLFLNDGPNYTGIISLNEIGIWHKESPDDYFLLEQDDVRKSKLLNKVTAHKGTYGKTLIIAGSDNIYGAAILASKSALYSGAGMVKVLSHINNKTSLERDIPEALFSFYNDTIDEQGLEKDISWADTIVIGPGLGKSNISERLLKLVLYCNCLNDKILIMDADAINIVSDNKIYLNQLSQIIKRQNVKCVMTPHKGELGRLKNLCNYSSKADFCKTFYDEFSVVIIDKGAHSKTVGSSVYINETGNDGMATAGSGDVLSGMLGGLLFRLGEEDFTRACAIVVWLHGKSGDIYIQDKSALSLTATGMVEAVVKSLDFLT